MNDSATLDCDYSADAGDSYIVQAKQYLLDLWEHLLTHCINKSDIEEVSPIIFSVILWIMKRPEFDLTHLRWDVHRTPMCEHHVVVMGYRYRTLLIATLDTIVKNMEPYAETLQYLDQEHSTIQTFQNAESIPESEFQNDANVIDECVPQFDDPLRSLSYITTSPMLPQQPQMTSPITSSPEPKTETNHLDMIDPLGATLKSNENDKIAFTKKKEGGGEEEGKGDGDGDGDVEWVMEEVEVEVEVEVEEDDDGDDSCEDSDGNLTGNGLSQSFSLMGEPFITFSAQPVKKERKKKKVKKIVRKKVAKKKIVEKKKEKEEKPESKYKCLPSTFAAFVTKALACLFFRYPCKQQEQKRECYSHFKMLI